MTSETTTASSDRSSTRHLTLGTRHINGWLILFAILALYALLQNPFWVRGGDSEVYLSLARSLAEGHGLRFNAQPVGLVPPGWPLLLAGVMKLAPQFAVLKLLMLLLTAAALTLYFIVLRELLGLGLALLATALTAFLPSTYRLTYAFLAEPMFCVAAGAALLLALRINRRNGGPWSIAALALLCLVALMARWTIVIFWPVIGAILLRGELWPRKNARWTAAIISGLVTIVFFVGMRHYLRVNPKLIDPRFDASLSAEYAIITNTATDDTLQSRLVDTDRWLLGLIFSPLHGTDETQIVLRCACYALLLILTVGAIDRARRREWVWLAVLAYYLALSVNWPQPVARYLVPVAPLLLGGVFVGLRTIARALPASTQAATYGGVIALIAACLFVPNAVTFASDVCDMRSDGFYQRYQSGTDQSLTQAARLFKALGTHSGELVVSRAVMTRHGMTFTNSWMRSIHFLTDIAVRNLPDDMGPEPDAKLAQWMNANHVELYLYQPAVLSLPHFRWRFWIDPTAKRLDTEWHLYRLHHGKFLRIRLKDDHLTWPASVPGL